MGAWRWAMHHVLPSLDVAPDAFAARTQRKSRRVVEMVSAKRTICVSCDLLGFAFWPLLGDFSALTASGSASGSTLPVRLRACARRDAGVLTAWPCDA